MLGKKGEKESSPKDATPKLTASDLIEEMPENIERLISDYITGEVLVASSTDMTLSGEYGTGWLIVTNNEIVSVDPDNGRYNVRRIDIRSARAIKLNSYYGNNLIRVITDEKAIDVIRYSKTLSTRFRGINEAVESLIEQAQEGETRPSLKPSSEIPEGRCAKCGGPIPRWLGTCPNCLEKRKLIFRLLGYAKPYWHLIAFSLALMTVAIWLELMQPMLTRSLIDDVLVSNDLLPEQKMSKLIRLGMMLVVILVGSSVIGAFRGYIMAWVGGRVNRTIRDETYEHLQKLGMNFYTRKSTGSIMSRITFDSSRLRDFIVNALPDMIQSFITLTIICYRLFSLNWKLAFLTLVPTPAMVILTIYFGEKMHKVWHSVSKNWSALNSILTDTIPGARVVKAFVQEKREINRFSSKSDDLFTAGMRSAKLESIFNPLMGFATFLGSIIIWFVGGKWVIESVMTLGTFTAFTGYMWRFYMPIRTLCRINHRFQSAAASADRIFEILDAQPEVRHSAPAIQLPETTGRIKFDNVTFIYEGSDTPALRNINLEVEPGEMIGLVGHSGAGKTTFINLICRFYEPTEGKIFIDGHDITELDIKSIRNQIGIVLQDPYLFSGTIAENIAYGVPNATMKEIIAAAKAANAHNFIMRFPDAYDTTVGERGDRLSMGERQRISIARAILKDPKILILDEATSSVDTVTESQIQEALDRLVTGRTTFAIAHRLSTLKNADRIIVLNKGEIVEIGTHDELVKMNGHFAELVKAQTELAKIREV